MSDATLQILRDAVKTVPFSYEVPGGQVLGLAGVRATFDGTGAGGAFLPCVQILSAAGTVMAQTVGSSVAAGASADVTFAPFLEAAETGGGGGIDFDTFPQNGDWLYVETTDATGSPNGWGTELYDSSAAGDGIEIHSDNGNLNFFCGVNATFSGFRTTVSAAFLLTIQCADIIINTSAQVQQEQSAALAGQRFKIPVAGGAHSVYDSLGAVIFEVRGDGSIHGRAAVGAITWDL